MTLTTTIRRTTRSRAVSLAALTAVSMAAAFGGASASAATIGAPEVLGPGQNLPIDVPAYREPADNKIKANYRLVRVRVEVARGERASVVMTAPKGFRAVTIAFGGRQVGGAVNDVNYSGKRSVRVRLVVNTRLVETGKSGRGTVYLWAKRA